MRKVFVYIWTFVCLHCYGQIEASDTLRIVSDFNGDHIADSLTIYSQRYSPKTVKVYNSRSGQFYSIGKDFFCEWNKSNFLDLIPIPDDLVLAENKQLLDTLIKILRPGFNTADISLDWLLQSYEDCQENPSDTLFDMFIKHEGLISCDSFVHPNVSYKLVAKDTLKRFWDRRCNEDDSGYNYGLLFYYGHNHRGEAPWPHLDTATTQYEVYSTAHGVYVKKASQYAWAFMTDGWLTGGPDKLRWKSIMSTQLHGDFLIIHQATSVMLFSQFFIVNLKNGNVGRLKDDENYQGFNSPDCVSYGVEDATLFIKSWRNEDCYYDDGGSASWTFNFNEITERLK